MESLGKIEQRLLSLERSKRRAHAALLALLGAAALALLTAQSPGRRPRTLEGEAFVLLDEAGKERAQLAVGKDGAVQLFMKNTDGITDAGLALGPDGAVTLRLRNARKTATLELLADGAAGVRIQEKYAKSSVELGLDSAGRPRLLLTEPDGKVSFKGP